MDAVFVNAILSGIQQRNLEASHISTYIKSAILYICMYAYEGLNCLFLFTMLTDGLEEAGIRSCRPYN